MGLVEQNLSFKFAGGIESKMDPKAVPLVRLLGLENGVFTKAVSIKKRNGYAACSRTIDGSTSLISDTRRLGAREDELLLFTRTRCYSKETDVDEWTDVGALIAPVGYDRPAIHTGTAQTVPDHATAGGVTVYAWEDSLGGVWWTVVDATSGAVRRAPTQANSLGERPRCVAVGDVLHVYYAVPTQSQVRLRIINPSDPTAAPVEQIVVEDLSSTDPAYDACPTTESGTPAVMVWRERGTFHYRLGFVTAGGALGSPVTGLPSVVTGTPTLDAATPLALAYSTTACAVVYQSGSFVHAAFHTTSTLAATGGAPAVCAASNIQRLAAVFDSAGLCWVVAEEFASEPTERHCTIVSTTSTVAGTQRVLRSVGLASRGFAIADDTYVTFVHDATYFNTFLTLRLSDFAPAGRHLPGSACGPTRSHLPSAQLDGDVVTIALPYKSRIASPNNDKFTESAIRRVVMDFDNDSSHQSAVFSSGLYLAAACPQHYDGYRWTEQGFHIGPEHIPYALASGGSLTSSATYEYKVWYEWTDKHGQIHRGPESPGLVVPMAGNTQVTLTLPTLRVTRKDNVRICVARSIPGDTSKMRRVTSLDPTVSGPNGHVANDTTVDSVTFVDRMDDTTLQTQEEIYTTGGILSNDPASLGSHVAAGRNRLFFTDAQDGNVVRFSQQRATGFGLEIAPELQLDIDPRGGDITALSVIDDIVFVFKGSSIYAFNGDGPYTDGSATSDNLVSGFSSPQRVPSGGVGCTDPASIVEVPGGLMFKSAKGIWKVTEAREVVYAGAPVEAYNSQNVTRAVALPDRTAVLFLTDSGSTLYYDYLFDFWSTFTNHEGLDTAVIDGTLYYLRTNDIVFRETPGQHADGTARIKLRLETAWCHLHEHLQGFQHFWKAVILGTWSSPHQLAVQTRTNYDEAWTEPYYLDATGDTDSTGWITGEGADPIGEDPITGSVYGDGSFGDGDFGGTGPDVYQWRYGIHEDGQSVQFRFEDFEKAGLAGASFELTELTIIGGIKKPDMRPFSSARST